MQTFKRNKTVLIIDVFTNNKCIMHNNKMLTAKALFIFSNKIYNSSEYLKMYKDRGEEGGRGAARNVYYTSKLTVGFY